MHEAKCNDLSHTNLANVCVTSFVRAFLGVIPPEDNTATGIVERYYHSCKYEPLLQRYQALLLRRHAMLERGQTIWSPSSVTTNSRAVKIRTISSFSIFVPK